MTPYYPQSESKGGWRSVHHNRKAIADLGLDQDKLDEFVQWNLSIQCDPPTQVGFIVIKNGWIAAEAYDRPETRRRNQWLASIGKSIASCSFGRWIDAGRRGDTQYPLELDSLVYNSNYLPEGFPLSDERKSMITFKHILTHTGGLPSGSDKYDSACFDFVDFTVGRCTAYPQSIQLLFDPGCGYEYSNIGYNHFSVISPHITGKPLYKDIEEGIWSRIGVESADWPERNGAFLRNGLVYQPAGSGPGMTTRDLARFAYLLLHKGQWEGHSIVPEWYLRTALQIDPINNSQPEHYGLGFYSNTTYQLAAQLPKNAFAMSGKGLNYVVIIPDAELIVIRTSRITGVINPALFKKDFIRMTAELIR